MEVKEGVILDSDGKELGKYTSLIADTKELPSLGEGDGVVHLSTPERIDLLFCAGEKIVGVECKRPEDFISSWQGRRLARQIKTMLLECDIAVVAIRGTLAVARPYRPVNWEQLWMDIVGWQLAGVLVLEVPDTDAGTLKYLTRLKNLLASENPPARALAGTDRKQVNERKPGWLLRRIPTIGPTASIKLMDRFKSVRKVFSAEEGDLRGAGLSVNQVKQIQKALDE